MFGTQIVFADWFSGKIVVPRGKRIQYVHFGYASIYERELHLSFKKGLKINQKKVSNKKIADKIRIDKREKEIAKQVQDTLFYQVKKTIEWDTTNTPSNYLCDDKYILTYNKKGKLKKVWVNWEGKTFREKIDDWWWNITDERKCRNKIKNALKPITISYLNLSKRRIKIPFDIFYRRETGELELWKESWMEE